MLAALVFGGLSAGRLVLGQATQPKEQAPQAAAAEEKYIRVTADELSRFPDKFFESYVQVADYFGYRVERFPADAVLIKWGVTPQNYYAFRTHRALASNMLCFAPRDNEEAKALFGNPLDSETQIYMMGRVGPRIATDDGIVPVFVVERIARGHAPPPTIKVEKKKPVILKIERPNPSGGVTQQEFQIPEPGKRYRIPDPSDPNNRSKDIYITLQF
jgi:hypothetical protein